MSLFPKYKSFSHEWTIDQFSLKLIQAKKLTCEISTPDITSLNWIIEFYPSGNENSFHSYSALKFGRKFDQLHRDHWNSYVWAKVKVSLKFRQNMSFGYQSLVHYPFSYECNRYYVWDNDKFEISHFPSKQKLLDDYVENERLTIKIEIITSNIFWEENDISHTETIQSYSRMFEDQIYCDVSINVDDQVIGAHKSVLSARSPVFRAMFQHNMIESKTNSVQIEDMNYQVCKELLRFIYTGTIGQIDDCRDLLVAADRYEILSLKDVCEKKLTKNVTSQNTIKYLLLASQHQLKTLEKSCFDFITNYLDVYDEQDLNLIKEKDPDLLVKMLLATKKKKKKQEFRNMTLKK